MKHEPLDSAQGIREALAIEDVSARTDALLAILPPCPGLPSTDAEIVAADARGLADFAAGRTHDHSVVMEWFETREPGLSFRDWIARRDG